MKIIFLDFDGVLNSTPSFLTGQRKRNSNAAISLIANPDESAVTLMDRLILSDPDNRVVISSSWRIGYTVSELQDILVKDFGLSTDATKRVISVTPRINGPRGLEIDHWLNQNSGNVTKFVIIDDNSDMLKQQKPYFVQTHIDDGFRWKDYEKAKNILGIKVEILL